MGELVKWLIIAFYAYGTVVTFSVVGKPRKPMALRQAVVVAIVNALLMTAILIWWS